MSKIDLAEIMISSDWQEGYKRHRMWDYTGHLKTQYDSTNKLGANEWIWSFGTKIQQVSSGIHQRTLRGGAGYIFTHSHLKPLFKKLPSFSLSPRGADHWGIISSRFRIYVDDTLPRETILLASDDIIKFTETGKLNVLTLPTESSNNDGVLDIPEIECKIKQKEDFNDIRDYYKAISDHIGYITVLNYKK